jgi:hemoglobin-like flavoprotein
MSPLISESTRRNLSRSLPLVEQHREDLVNCMEASLRAAEPSGEAYGQSEVASMILVGLLLEQVRSVVNRGELGDLRDVADEHRSLAIDGRHYSRFGDSLVANLRDLLGPKLPTEVTAAWCDTFWTTIRSAQVQLAPSA